MNLEEKIDAAFEAAKAAVSEAKARYGNDRGSCGFSWVEVPDGRSPLAKALKKRGAQRHWHRGVYIWNPGESNWQNIDVTAAGSRAFAALFPGEAHAASRLD